MRGRSSKRRLSGAPQFKAGIQPTSAEQPERVSLQLIADKLARLTWRRRPWGVDERQVWHVVQRLDEMYRQLYREQELRYQALLAQRQAAVPQATQVAPTPDSTVGIPVQRQAQQMRQQPQPLVQPQPPQQVQPLQQPLPSPYQQVQAQGHRFRTPGSHRFRTS